MSSPLVALENLRSGLGETKVDPVAENEEASVIDKTFCYDRVSWIVEEGGDSRWPSCRGLIVEKVPNEESPSSKEARERAASFMLDIRLGYKCWPLFFIF